MRAAIFIITTVLGLAFCCGHARAQSLIYAFGEDSCADWLHDAYSEHDGRHWIAGYWSGMNATNAPDHRVGHDVAFEGVLGEVKKICREHPSKRLSVAVFEVYNMIATEHR
jgi:hypothetical protein